MYSSPAQSTGLPASAASCLLLQHRAVVLLAFAVLVCWGEASRVNDMCLMGGLRMDILQVSFRSYWTRELLNVLREERNLSIKQIGALTSIRSEDIIATLQSLSLLKYWKGQYIINVTPKIVEEHMRSLGPAVRPGQATMKPRLLNWQPPVAPVV
jgi:hypothetical protein